MATVSLQAVYDQARRLLESGDADRAGAVAQHIIRSFPRNLEAHRLLGEAYLAERQFEQAEDAFQSVLYSDPENIPAYVGLGVANERLGHLDQAIQAFEHALEIKPDMAELRSQLLRLYTESWGSESAQLRLSRAGLARLYAKGHMQPQAIQEFRSVIAEQPDRFDARVALAEVLWRDGQEDAAIATCQEILAERPETLKANLILGYLLLAAGDPKGEQYWNTALELDPYQTTARSLFDQLPSDNQPQPMLSEWNEQEWQDQRTNAEQHVDQQEQHEPHTEPVMAANTSADDDDFFGGSWMDTIGQEQSEQPISVGESGTADDDDFLARLLAFESLGPDTALDEPITAVNEPEVAPFSFEAAGTAPSTEPAASTPAVSETPTTEDEAATTPFSFADLGLSDEEIAAFNAPAPDAEQVEEAAAEPIATSSQTPVQSEVEPELTPFSFADLGLSDEEIAAFNMPEVTDQAPIKATETPAQAQPSAQTEAEPDLTPFSFSDLGLSDEEIASFNTPAPANEQASVEADESSPQDQPTAHAEDEPDLTPFSFSDLGLSDEEIASLGEDSAASASSQTPVPAEANQNVQHAIDQDVVPFSLDDLGLDPPMNATPADSASKENTGTVDDLAGVTPFSMEDWSLDEPGTSGAASTNRGDNTGDFDVSDELQPFSLDDLDINAGASDNDFDFGSLPPSLQPFSLDDVGETLSSDTSERSQAAFNSPEEDEPASESGGYSFRQAPSKRTTDFGRDTSERPQESGTSIFAKLRQRRSELPQEEPPPLLPVADDETDMSLFSHDDDVSLRDALAEPEPAATSSTPVAASTESAEAAPALSETTITEPEASTSAVEEPTLTPFSLSDLGLSPEEIASLNLEEPASAEAAATETNVAESASATADEPDLTPFSLSDLGLSPEEIAALGLGEETPITSTTTTSSVSEEPDLTPFSLSDLGLSPEEIAALGIEDTYTPTEEANAASHSQDEDQDDNQSFNFDLLGEAPPALSEAVQTQEDIIGGDLQPFSLDDLGLSDDDFQAYGLGDAGGELGLTEEELATMDLGVFEKSSTQSNTSASAGNDEVYEVDTGDPVLDKLITIGRRQGFVDLTDIIAAVTNPEEESERIEEIGQVLHRAGIQIHDGDEIIDMDEVDEEGDEEFVIYAEDTPDSLAPTPSTTADETDMTPFSLSDLGLSAEEIAALGLDETEDPSTSSLSASASTPDAPAVAPTNEEPDLTPFSLSDLGLSPEEIAALGLDEPTSAAPSAVAPVADTLEQPTAVSTSEEPDLTPFSLSDLGLSPEEIAAFEQQESVAESTASPEEPVVEPSVETEAEPDLMPFSLSDLGLSPEEIASLELPDVDSPDTPASSQASAMPDVPATNTEETDVFDFSAAEEAPRQTVPVTPRPRQEEPPVPQSPEDLAFVPEPLEAMDSIWEAVPAQSPSAPAPVQPEQSASAPAVAPVQPEQPVPPRAATERPAHIETITRPPRPEPERPSAARPSASREPTRSEPSRASTTPATTPAPEPVRRTEASRPARAGTPKGKESVTAFIPTGDETLDGYLRQLEAEPDNDPLRLAVARVSGQTGRLDLAIQQYKALARSGSTLDQIEDDVQELIAETEDQKSLQRLYRILGDVYTKQNRFREAVEAYSWTFGK